jgi:DNA repair protein RadD
MPYELRTYQAEAAQAGIEFLLNARKRNGIIVAPTGCGKSLIISAIARGLDGPCLVFQPSKEILEQNLQKFQSYGYRPAVYSASMGRKTVGEITLATIGSVAGASGKKVQRASKAHLFRDFPYVIVDECHAVGAKSGAYKAFFEELDVKILGLTATPYRLVSDRQGTMLRWMTRTRPRIFHETVYYIQSRDLFDEGYLARPEYQIVKGFDRRAVRANSTGADFDERALQLHFFKIHFSDKIVKVVRRLLEIGRTSILVFTRFIPEAEYVAHQIPGAAVVTAETPKDERAALIAEFRKGRIPVIANVNCLSTGFDYPELENVVIARPTKSLALWYQMAGRVVRPTPNKQPWVVDMVGLTQEFGKIEDLKIVDGGNGKWFIENGERELTNVRFDNEGASRCHDCGAPVGFWTPHVDTGNRAPLQRPTNGQQANINLVRKDGKTYYTVVKPGEGEFLHHAAVCERRRRVG